MFLSTGLFLIFCALYGISSGVSAILRLFSRNKAGRFGAVNPVMPDTGPRARDGALGQYIADLDRLLELERCGALSRQEFEALKHHLMQRVASAT